MYDDQQSIQAFERQHARDRMVELARRLEDTPSGELFEPHAKAGDREGLNITILSIAAVGALLGAIVLLAAD